LQNVLISINHFHFELTDNTFRIYTKSSARPAALFGRAGETRCVETAPPVLGLGFGVVSAQVIKAATDLRLIARFSAGYENVDIQSANARRIPVVITAGATSQALAEDMAAVRGRPQPAIGRQSGGAGLNLLANFGR
jgi:phosphoglycerate dehydrogenase-like enzyme